MRAVDTNVLARYAMQDDPMQTPVATAILAEPCYIADTVLLEFAWLLASRYRLDRTTVAGTLEDLISLPTVTTEDEALLRWAIARFASGADFADMMHLISGRGAECFATFERRLVHEAGADAPLPIETLSA